ncbi:hypothetical protein HDU83_000644 [Entophlyctis luteolus]|nr:hypothetical protein HDU83_000644 [Entophlyctis luteolus]
MMDEWPQLYRKIELYLMSRELLYVLEKEINYLKIPANESIEEKRVREKGLIDDARVCSIIVNKLSKDAFNLVGHESSAYRMITGLRDKYKSDSTASVIARLDKLFDLVYDPARTLITSHVADMKKNEKMSTGFNRKMAFNLDQKKEKNGFIKAKFKCYKCQKMGHFA